MRLGKVSETIMNRSVRKQLPKGLDTETFKDIAISDVSVYGQEEQLGIFAFAQAVNQIVIKGANPVGVNVTIVLPPDSQECFLKAVVSHLAWSSRVWEIPILSVQAEVSPAIYQPLMLLTAVGKDGGMHPLSGVKKPVGWDIVMTKWIGMGGTLRILCKEREALSKRFTQSFLRGIDEWQEMLYVRDEIKLARAYGGRCIRQVTKGGIFAALWDLAAETGTGLKVRMEQITIRQETVELCECYQINPYQLDSSGCILMLAKDGGSFTDILSKHGVKAVVLGKTCGNREKVIYRGGETRFLDRPAPDELIKLYSGQKEEH